MARASGPSSPVLARTADFLRWRGPRLVQLRLGELGHGARVAHALADRPQVAGYIKGEPGCGCSSGERNVGGRGRRRLAELAPGVLDYLLITLAQVAREVEAQAPRANLPRRR